MIKECLIKPKRIITGVGNRAFDRERTMLLSGREILLCLDCGTVDEILKDGKYRRLTRSNYAIIDEATIVHLSKDEQLTDFSKQVVDTVEHVTIIPESEAEVAVEDNTTETTKEELVEETKTEEVPVVTTEDTEVETKEISEETVEETKTEETNEVESINTEVNTEVETKEVSEETVEETKTEETTSPYNKKNGNNNNYNNNKQRNK